MDYSDGEIAVRVYNQLTPPALTHHFYKVANAYRGGMQQCATRATQTLHLGAKEYTPPKKHQEKMGGNRIWRQDNGISKEYTKAILPELIFADSILAQVSPESHALKMERVDKHYRLANTCWTRAAVNSTNCRLHRDTQIGLDVLLYAGDWMWGGELIIPQLGIKIFLQPGDVIVMDSGLFHKVMDFEGTRYVIVFFTKSHQLESKAGNKLYVPIDLRWLSNDLFQDK